MTSFYKRCINWQKDGLTEPPLPESNYHTVALLGLQQRQHQATPPLVQQPTPLVQQPTPLVQQPTPLVQQPTPLVQQPVTLPQQPVTLPVLQEQVVYGPHPGLTSANTSFMASDTRPGQHAAYLDPLLLQTHHHLMSLAAQRPSTPVPTGQYHQFGVSPATSTLMREHLGDVNAPTPTPTLMTPSSVRSVIQSSPLSVIPRSPIGIPTPSVSAIPTPSVSVGAIPKSPIVSAFQSPLVSESVTPSPSGGAIPKAGIVPNPTVIKVKKVTASKSGHEK